MKVIFRASIVFFSTFFLLSGALIAQGNEFDRITLAQIQSCSLSSGKINGSKNASNQIPAGSILLYRTNQNRYGKLQVKTYGYNLIIRWKTYNANGNIFSQGEDLTIRGTYSCDLDAGQETENGCDFWWQQVDDIIRYFIPQNGAKFAVYTGIPRDTIIFDQPDMSDTFIPEVFEGFTIQLNSGPSGGEINFGDFSHALGVENMYIDIPDIVVQKWYTFGAKIHLYLHDLNLNSWKFFWSLEKGGCLKLTTTFEEEGKEILGTWHGDIWDAVLTVYFIPTVDSFNALRWQVEVDFNFQEEIYGIPESWFWSKDKTINDLKKAIKYSLTNEIQSLMVKLLDKNKGLRNNADVYYYHVSVTDNYAQFILSRLDSARSISDIKVLFDNIYVHSDEDWFGSGELYFRGDVNGNSTEWSNQKNANSGSHIYLSGNQWERYASVVQSQLLNIHFEGYDDDVTTEESLGSIDLTSTAPDWNVRYTRQNANSSNGDYTLYYWILPRETPTGYKRLAVKFDRIDVRSDEDSYGSGELFFIGEVNSLSTGWGGQYDRDSGTEIYLGGKGRWEKTVYVSEGETLNISFRGYDDDTFSDDGLGNISIVYSAENNWGIGCHRRLSDNDDFTLNYRIVDLDAPRPESSDVYLVTFLSVQIHSDEDNNASGELFFFGAVNCDYTSLSQQMDLNSGDSRDLMGGNWFKRVYVDPQTGKIHLFFSGYDEDVTTVETLGDIEVFHSADDNWGLNSIHSVTSDNGDFTLRYQVQKL